MFGFDALSNRAISALVSNIYFVSIPYTETNIYIINVGNVLDTAIELW